MVTRPGGGLRAARGLWSPRAPALRGMVGRDFESDRPTELTPGADHNNPVPPQPKAAR